MKPVMKSVVCALLIGLTLNLTACSAPPTPLNETLNQYGIKISSGTESLLIKRDFQQTAKDKNYHYIIAQDKNLRIEVETIRPLSEKEGKNLSITKHETIKGLYGPRILPYPANITQTTGAPADKKPIEKTVKILGEEHKALIANASERYVLGVWDDVLIEQIAVYVIFYDASSKTAYQFILFSPIRKFDEKKVLDILRSIKRT